MAEHRDFTLEDILAEQRRKREGQEAPAPAQPVEELPAAEPQAGAVPEYQEQAARSSRTKNRPAWNRKPRPRRPRRT